MLGVSKIIGSITLKSTFNILILNTMVVIQDHTDSYRLFGIKEFDNYW